MKSFSFFVATSAAVLAGTNLSSSQDVNAAFITKCSAGQWALTFDDGPSPFTPSLLASLKAEGVVATFYVLGVQLENAEFAKATKAAFDAGHLIASHTYSHLDLNTLTSVQIKDQMSRSEALIKKTIGFTPNYMRPPFGNCNTTCAAIVKEAGYTVTNWNVDTNDWRVVGTADEPKAFDAFTTALSAADVKTVGHMSLQHDTLQFSTQMVPKAIAAIKAKGLTFVTADKCGSTPAYRETGAPSPGASEVAPSPGASNVAPNEGNEGNSTVSKPGRSPSNVTSTSGASELAACSLGFAIAGLTALIRL